MDEHRSARTSWPLLEGLSRPALAVDEQGRIAFLNSRAEDFWGIRLADVAGLPAADVLRIGPRDGGPFDEWARTVVGPAMERGTPVPAQVISRYGHVQLIDLTAMWESREGRRYALVTISARTVARETSERQPATRDPLTGLLTFHARTAEFRQWNARGGTVVLFDLDALREINALHGASAGDAVLATAGRALAAETPPGALAARYSQDELLLLLAAEDAASAEKVARRVVDRVAHEAPQAGVPVAPRLHYGLAPFGPGNLAAALVSAMDVLYQHRGALLQAESGGRLVLTREGRAALQAPGGEAKAAPGAFASNFGPEFDRYFRQACATAAEQAREFVAFADPQPGSAVVEVGAGSGRITFDGGLAERIGPKGQLLVTDPSAAQLQVARDRAVRLGFDWVRFLCAPVEALPLSPGTADLCLGAAFLHFTEPAEAIGAMARIVRRGGRVAVCAGLDIDWPAPWQEILAPVHRVLREHGLALELFLSRAALESAFRAAGLTIDRVEESVGEMDYRTADIAIAMWRQIRFVPLMLRRLPPDAARGVEEAVEARMRDIWSRAAPEDLVLPVAGVNIVAHR